MSNSDAATVKVIADAAYPTAEIYILNQSLAEVASSVGSLETRLIPGLYKIRYVAGEDTAEEIFEVPLSSESVCAPKLPVGITSPICLSPTGANSLDPEAAFATSISRAIEPRNVIGRGGELLVVVRGPEAEDNAKSVAAVDIGTGLKLCDKHGAEILDLGQILIPSPQGTMVGCSLALDPGSYLLRMGLSEHPLVEQALVVCEQWQTQVFVPTQANRRAPGATELDLSEAGILMGWQGEGFDPARPEAAWAELSRQALADRRPSAPVKALRAAVNLARGISAPPEIFRHKFTDPMLGIYAAHLLTLSQEPDKTLLHEMADNLRQLVGDHPDVMSLYLWLDPKAKVPPFSMPPMLRNSWDIVVDSSFDRPDLVPPGSYGSRIATRLWGSGVWLTWRVPDRLSWSASPATSTELNSFFDLFLKRDGAAAAFSRAAEALQSKETLGEAERRLLAYVGGIVKGGSSAGRFAWDGTGSGLRGAVRSIIVTMIIPWIQRQTRNAAKNILKPESIIRALGMPEATLAQTAGDLLAKLNALRLLPIERRGARTAADVLAEEFVALRPDGQLEDQTLDGIYRSIHNFSSDQAALCLAGDGLRGAFFDLGVLEGLARYGLLGKFHYLSTVSGGSYTGAWLSAWRHHAEDEAGVLSAMAAGPLTLMQNPVGRPVVQLSEVNDFLMARRGVLSFGMWTRCGAYARNLLLTWLVYGPLFLTFLMVPKIYLALVVFSWKAPFLARMVAFSAATIFLLCALTVREFRKIASLGRRGVGSLHPKQGYWFHSR